MSDLDLGRRIAPHHVDAAPGPTIEAAGARSARPAPRDRLMAMVTRCDAAVDGTIEPLRGKPAFDAAAAVLSNLADYGVVWVLLAAYKGRRPGSARWRAVRALAVAGMSSYTVSKSIKWATARERPDEAQRRLPIRPPSSSSFPSGHTLAAACTAVLLADTPPQAAAFFGFAGAVAMSRVHLRDHHPSDVLAGLVIGAAMGAAGRRLLE